MAGTSLNDIVVDWGGAHGHDDYNSSKTALVGPYYEQAHFARLGTWNEGLAQIADLMADSALWLDAAYSTDSAYDGVGGSEPRARNLGGGDRTGVSGAVIYNGAAVLPGVSGNYLSVPDEAALDITGDFCLIADVETNWAGPGSGNWRVINKQRSGTLSGYDLLINGGGAGGTITVAFGDGSAVRLQTSDTGLPSGTYRAKVAVTVDINNGASGWDAKFWYQLSGETSWTQLGGTKTQATAGVVVANAEALHVGTRGGTDSLLPGSVHSVAVYGGIGANTAPGQGTLALDVDLSTVDNWATSFTATTGQTVTVNTTAAKGGAPSALDAKYGSVLGAYVYDGAAVLPGIASNYLSTPSASSLNPSGSDIEIVVRTSIPDTTPAAQQQLVYRYSTNNGYYFAIQTTGLPVLVWGTGAAALVGQGATSLTTAGVSDGDTIWLKVTLDADNGAGGHLVSFFWAEDQATVPTSWTAMGTATGGAGTTTRTDAAIAMTLGSTAGPHNLHRVIVRDGIGGADLLDVDLANVDDYATSFTATTGQTVTVNSTTSDTNDPKLLTHTGENYVYLPGVAGNYMTVADNAAFTPATSDFEVILRMSKSDWTPSADQTIVSKDNQSTNREWYLNISSTGFVHFVWWNPAGTIQIGYSTIALPFTDGETYWIRTVLDVDNGAGGWTVRHYYAADQATAPTSWTQLGADITGGDTTGVRDQAANFTIGAAGAVFTSSPAEVSLKHIELKIGGVTTFLLDALTDVTSASATTLTPTTGPTLTIGRATSGRKTALVTRPIWLFGTDDYLEVADNALLDFGASDDFTVMLVARSFGTSTAFPMGKRNGNTAAATGYSLELNTTPNIRARITDGTNLTSAFITANYTPGELVAWGMIRDRTAQEFSIFQNTEIGAPSADTTTGSLVNSIPLYIGAIAGVAYANIEIVAAAVWRRVLTTDEIAAICTYYGTA